MLDLSYRFCVDNVSEINVCGRRRKADDGGIIMDAIVIDARVPQMVLCVLGHDIHDRT